MYDSQNRCKVKHLAIDIKIRRKGAFGSFPFFEKRSNVDSLLCVSLLFYRLYIAMKDSFLFSYGKTRILTINDLYRIVFIGDFFVFFYKD